MLTLTQCLMVTLAQAPGFRKAVEPPRTDIFGTSRATAVARPMKNIFMILLDLGMARLQAKMKRQADPARNLSPGASLEAQKMGVRPTFWMAAQQTTMPIRMGTRTLPTTRAAPSTINSEPFTLLPLDSIRAKSAKPHLNLHASHYFDFSTA